MRISDWSSDVCSSDLARLLLRPLPQQGCCVTALTSSIPAFDHDELIQSHPVATLLIDRGGVVLLVNAAAEQLCNLSRSALVGRVVSEDRKSKRLNSSHQCAPHMPSSACKKNHIHNTNI